MNRVFERNPEGRRGRGRLKHRWKDDVVEDYRKLAVNTTLRTDVIDKTVWRTCYSKRVTIFK